MTEAPARARELTRMAACKNNVTRTLVTSAATLLSIFQPPDSFWPSTATPLSFALIRPLLHACDCCSRKKGESEGADSERARERERASEGEKEIE